MKKDKYAALRKMPDLQPGLEEIIRKNLNHTFFNNDITEAIRSGYNFYMCGTPLPSGKPDLTALDDVAKIIGKSLNGYKIIVNKSTVPIGTAKRVKKIIKENIPDNIPGNSPELEFDMVSNPEFLKEGEAVADAFFPERVVIGSDSERATKLMKELYKPIINQDFEYASSNSKKKEKVPIVITDSTSSEMIKYSSNAFLATKISFINEIANICERVGANILDVTYGMGLDSSKSNYESRRTGGSCFQKM